MAAELAAGYVSLTVKLAKGGMADVTKEVKQAGKAGGEAYSDEFNKKVGTDVAKKLPDTIGKATKKSGGGGLKQAAKDAADEFGKGFRDGIDKALDEAGIDKTIEGAVSKSGMGKAAKTASEEFGKGFRDGVKNAIEDRAIEGALDVLSNKIEEATKGVKDFGKDIGFDTGPIERASEKTVKAVDGINTAVSATQSAVTRLKDGNIAGALQNTVDALKGLEAVGVPQGFVTDLQGIATAAASMKGAIDAFGQHDIAGTMQGTIDALKGLESIGLSPAVSTELQTASDRFKDLKEQMGGVTGAIKGLGELAPGSKFAAFADQLGPVGDILAGLVTVNEEVDKLVKKVAKGDPKKEAEINQVRGKATGMGAVWELVKNPPKIDVRSWFVGPEGVGGAGGILKFFTDIGGTVKNIPDEKTVRLHALTTEAEQYLKDFGFKVEHMPDGEIEVIAETDAAKAKLDELTKPQKVDINATYRVFDTSGAEVSPSQWRNPQRGTPAFPGDTGPHGPGRAGGGPITGPGGPKSDIIPIWASSGEHVLSAADVAAMGGQEGVYAFRKMLGGFSGGGAVEGINYAASISGKPYLYGGIGPGSFDCSGAQSAVFAALTGKPQGTRYFNTESNFESLGFQRGFMAGAYNIGISRGGGGKLSHMGATLPNGVTFEAGGANRGVMYGDGARGANSFPLQYFLPVAGGDQTGGAGGAGGAGNAGGGNAGGAGNAGGTPGGGGTPSGLSDNPMRALQQLGEQQNALDTQKAEQVKKLLPDFGQLADIAAGGLKETFLPPGFSDPTQWKSTKSIGALLGFIGGISGDPATASILGGIGQGITGSGSGLVNGIMGAIPQPFGNLAPPTADQFAVGPGGAAIPAGPMPPNLFGAPGVSIGTYNDNSGNSAYANGQKESHANSTPERTVLNTVARS